MGLLKTVAIDGVPCGYHRIYNVVINTNQCNAINVFSYLSKDQRDQELAESNKTLEEREADMEKGLEPFSPYIAARLISAPYAEDMTISKAYEWLKTLPEFKGATDEE